jgi:hypothetical protein
MAVLLLSLEKQYLPMYQRQRRLFDGGTTVLPPVADPVKTAATAPIRSETMIPEGPSTDLIDPVGGGNAGGGANDGAGDGGGEEDDQDARPVGSPLFK